MKQLLQQYSAYNLWANKRIVETIKLLSADQTDQTIVSSFPSIKKTAEHMMDAESMWWQRLKLAEHVERPSEKNQMNFDEISKLLLLSSQQWLNWVQETSESNLTHVFAYYNTKKEHFKQPIHEMLMHLFNHQTYHRGQLVLMLRQSGVDKIPATDFIAFTRKKS
ncbi:damage-inducible protein DinB [soil metagenome]